MKAVHMEPMARRLLTVAHAAEALDCTTSTVHRLRLSGRLRGVRLSAGGVWRIDVASIDVLLGSPEVRDRAEDPEAVAREAQAALAAMRPAGAGVGANAKGRNPGGRRLLPLPGLASGSQTATA